jgi:sec-independent protein translocase protein TatA
VRGHVELLFWVPGGWEIALIGGLIVLVFFGNRIPEAMRSLGRGITQFRKGLREGKEEGGGASADGKEALPTPKEGEGGADPDTRKEKPADAAPGASEPDSEKKDRSSSD